MTKKEKRQELEERLRSYLRAQGKPVRMAQIKKDINIRERTLGHITLKMSDIAETDKGLIFII